MLVQPENNANLNANKPRWRSLRRRMLCNLIRYKYRDGIQPAVSELKRNVSAYKKVNDDEIHVKVSSNLLDRHSQLYWLEQLTRRHQVHKALVDEHDESKKSDQGSGKSYPNYYRSNQSIQHDFKEKLLPEERVYHLAVTDLFVEKAQAFLEDRADSYQRSGKIARWMASAIVFGGAVLAWQQMISHHSDIAASWLALASSFTRAFTAYGMVVLAAVGFWRYSKSMLDQSERLYERRHALRQGRLFVHLNDGKLTIDEMERAFKWNESHENAFAHINTEAAAPWGVIAKEVAKGFPEVFKAGMQAVGKGKSEEKS
jgi:hypothetical protein